MSEERIRRLEEQVADLYAHLGLRQDGLGTGGIDADIQQMINDGKKIHAIKHYRERTGAGLAQAKGAIEAWENRYKLG
jgi:ribosomal protein L7/L12